jgi:hypothetical protein
MDCNGNKEGNDNGEEGGGQATVMVTKRAMATEMTMMVVGNKEGNGTAAKAMATAMRMAGKQQQ